MGGRKNLSGKFNKPSNNQPFAYASQFFAGNQKIRPTLRLEGEFIIPAKNWNPRIPGKWLGVNELSMAR